MDKQGAYRVRVTPTVDLYQQPTGAIVQEYNPDHPRGLVHCVQWGWIENQQIQRWNDTLTVSGIWRYFDTALLRLAEVMYAAR